MSIRLLSATIFLITTVMIVSGCMSEANFELAPESRLPKWFEVPSDKSRSDFRVTLDSYVYPSGPVGVYKLYYKDSFFSSKKVSGTPSRLELKNPPTGSWKDYPIYVVVTINGVTDITEHKKMEPIFYMTDDPAVWKALGVEK